MRLFLDTSVLLAACNSTHGASSEIFRRASTNGWLLVSIPYCMEEVVRNLPRCSPTATMVWAGLSRQLAIKQDVLIVDWPAVFPAGKDRPVLFSALAWTDVLLTLDVNDFGVVMEKPFYGLSVMKPGIFLERERAVGRLV